MNKILFVDTCGKRLVLSFIFNDLILDLKLIDTNKNMTEIFNSELDKFFKKNKIEKNEINKIYTINGPGSFVGVKIGVVFANLYSYLNSCEMYYLDSCTFQAENENTISIIDARGNLFYTKIMNNKNSKIELMSMEEIEKISQELKIEIINNYDNYNFEKCWFFNNKKFKKTNDLKVNYVKEPI